MGELKVCHILSVWVWSCMHVCRASVTRPQVGIDEELCIRWFSTCI